LSAIGTVLRDRYELITELGKGGMSTVYLAKDRNLDSYWAVKQVKNSSSVDIDAFKKEVELLSSLSHSDIPRIVDRIEVNDDFFVVMDFVDGTSLGKKVLTEGPLPEDHVVEWAKMLCDVLDYLHHAKANPIIYRDMKPDNVMLTQSGRIKLIDFGIARECRHGEKQTGASIGTRGYAAPEQYKGASNLLDERTDIYSLGATLYYLATGNTPAKPPKAFRPIRQINPLLSEGFEYIVAKCTKDDPQDRYQNCKELRDDLNHIQQLSGAYRSKMNRKLMSFAGSLLLAVVFGAVAIVGYNGMKADNEDKFQSSFQLASSYDRKDDYANASKYYFEAIQYKPEDANTYLLLFNSLLPHTTDSDFAGVTKSAVDEIKNRYIDNKNSPMYHNSVLMYQVVQRCLEVNDPAYAQIAADYIQIIKASSKFQDGSLNVDNIENYDIIASNCSKDISTQDFSAFSKALIDLESTTDAGTYSADEKLENYYTIMVMYSTYPNNLDKAFDRISQIGTKAKNIIESNSNAETMTFNSIIPMYELVASGLYNNAVTLTDVEQKESAYLSSLTWFGSLSDLGDDLTETLELKKGNAYKGIFELYNTLERQDMIDSAISGNLDSAVEVYNHVISKNGKSFLAHVYLTQALLDKELCKPTGNRDFTQVSAAYDEVVSLKNNDKNLSSIALSQLSSLKQQMQNTGLEG